MDLISSSQPGTRARIVELADQLFYERGYEHTSFADIAAAVQLSRGNFYYHFKSKDDILDAVIDRRVKRTHEMLGCWSYEAPTPEARLSRFIHMMVMNSAQIRRHGCPVGTLCTELAKLEHPAQPKASRLFVLFRDWIDKQFAQIGAGHQARSLAMHLLARSQGIATLANAFDDEGFIHQEVEQLLRWLHDTVSLIQSKAGG
ncbi:MAG TPA: TetR/AcrR family transcriptional regulator [Aquabacterium sp.]|nr:TetR/AcrR family transcriptional regulator [Aquabacterium sp.]